MGPESGKTTVSERLRSPGSINSAFAGNCDQFADIDRRLQTADHVQSPGLRQFEDYFRSRDPLAEYPGSRGIDYIDRIPAANVDRYIQNARTDGFPDFLLRELEPNRDERFIIRYIYPLEGNEGATGLDIGSEANRRRAALRAASSGSAQLTEPITLVQASGQQVPDRTAHLGSSGEPRCSRWSAARG